MTQHTFNHIKHDFPSLIQENTERGRFYLTPNGERYPSVTTVLGDYDSEGLIKWKNRVGEETANKISKRSKERGTSVHKALEILLDNKDTTPYVSKMMPSSKKMYLEIKKDLIKKVNNVHCSETSLYSHSLKIAGKVDCIAEYNGVLSVIDFKTSNRLKEKKYISGYLMQAAAYRRMFIEMSGIPINQVIIMIGVENSNFCQKMVSYGEELQMYEDKLIEQIDSYYAKRNNLILHS